MATGYSIGGVDLDQVVEISRHTGTDGTSNFDTDVFKQTKSGLTPLSHLCIGNGAPYEEYLYFGGLFIQSPLLSPLLQAGLRPRFSTHNSWSRRYIASGILSRYHIRRTTTHLSIYKGTWNPLARPIILHKTFDRIEHIPASSFPNGVIPRVLYFWLVGGGGGGHGGGYWRSRGGGGAGAGATLFGWMPVLFHNEAPSHIPDLPSNQFEIDLGTGGTGGDWSGWGSSGTSGNYSAFMFNGGYLAYARGGKRGGSQSGGSGGIVDIRSSSYDQYHIFGLNGANGGSSYNNGGSVSYTCSNIFHELMSISRSGGIGDTGGGGGASSRGDGGHGGGESQAGSRHGSRGSGGGGGRGGPGTANSGGDGGDGEVTFFY